MTTSEAFNYSVLPENESVSPPAVWIIDDDPDDQLLLKSAFLQTSPGVSVTILGDGEELIELVDELYQGPSLLVMDLNMPRVNGFEALQAIRKKHSREKLPVIILTTSSDTTDQQRSLALGANQFFTKPTTYGELAELVRKLVAHWQLA